MERLVLLFHVVFVFLEQTLPADYRGRSSRCSGLICVNSVTSHVDGTDLSETCLKRIATYALKIKAQLHPAERFCKPKSPSPVSAACYQAHEGFRKVDVILMTAETTSRGFYSRGNYQTIIMRHEEGAKMKSAIKPNKYWSTYRLMFFALIFTSILAPCSAMANHDGINPGNLDPTFGEGGMVISDFFGHFAIVTDIGLQSDGKIVAVGGVDTDDFAIARFNPDGSLDSAFGDDGIVTTDFYNEQDFATAVAIQPDGKIIVVGYGRRNNNPDFALARYNEDGTLDETFGQGGKVLTDFFGEFDQAYDVALQRNRKIVVVGHAERGASIFALARYNRDGSLDASFGDGGKATTIFPSDDHGLYAHGARAVALQSNGKIIAVGDSNGMGPDTDFALARYNRDGSLDENFGNGGMVTTDFMGSADFASDIALQQNGKIVVAGSAFVDSDHSQDFALARYNKDGSLDETFGDGGMVATDFAGDSDTGSAMALLRGGKILLVGLAYITNVGSDFGLALYNQDGSLDESFGDGGRVMTDFFAGNDEAKGVAIQRDGKILVVGYGQEQFALARYIGIRQLRFMHHVKKYNNAGLRGPLFRHPETRSQTIR